MVQEQQVRRPPAEVEATAVVEKVPEARSEQPRSSPWLIGALVGITLAFMTLAGWTVYQRYMPTPSERIALVRAGLGQARAAADLLAEVDSYPGARDTANYSALLPSMVRTAMHIGEPALAERLVTGLEPRYPNAEHALVAANAALAEARGDLQDAADAYADAAERWDRFGVVPEQAFALLGQGRCLVGLSRPDRSRARPAARPRDLRTGCRQLPRSPRPTRSWQQATVLNS